ncbi:MAG: polysaccharide deacetylase [Lachnospiraceae bacterium]|nr:polysaccharide deacetylase [Lachnospiraceae bacterium]
MPENDNRSPEEIELERRRRREAKRRRQAKKRRQRLIKRAILFAVLVVVLIVCVVILMKTLKKDKAEAPVQDILTEQTAPIDTPLPESEQVAEEPAPAPEADAQEEAALNATGDKGYVLQTALAQAQTYDYDGALATLASYTDQNDGDVQAAAADYTARRDSCVAVDVAAAPHIFFHSLINDNRAFIVTDQVTEGRVTANNAAMATVDEFDHVLQYMYDAGFVLISLDDMVTVNADGTFSKNTNLMLPPGKKPFIMSEDDLSYYHSYGENGVQGYADRLVLDENGEVKCRFVDKDGVEHIGDYDMVPRLETFIKNHPDFAYHNARPTIALTGYNGVFGYVTNDYYANGGDMENLGTAQIAYLQNHPEYDYDTACAEATKIADALKAAGWTFASHTYGHLDANAQPLETLQRDHERWKIAVEKIIGPTDKIIFAFGADIGGASEYTRDNPKYAYFADQGFKFFCNCDGTLGWCQINPNFVRTGRFAIDGFTLYQAMTPDAHSHARCSSNYEALGIHDIAAWFDPDRTTPIESE